MRVRILTSALNDLAKLWGLPLIYHDIVLQPYTDGENVLNKPIVRFDPNGA
jgi:hypothetical protein